MSELEQDQIDVSKTPEYRSLKRQMRRLKDELQTMEYEHRTAMKLNRELNEDFVKVRDNLANENIRKDKEIEQLKMAVRLSHERIGFLEMARIFPNHVVTL